MQLRFIKMQGAGNDYIYFDYLSGGEILSANQIEALSDRHFGIGGDGVVFILPSQAADCKMRMFNSDGSEGKMCGNAIRCVAKYAYESGAVLKDSISVETASGIKEIALKIENGIVKSARVKMGSPIFTPEKIPVRLEGERVIGHEVTVDGESYKISCVSMGNPHCVLFVDDVEKAEVAAIGKRLESCKLFPERANIGFAEIVDDKTIKLRVWERGSGETLACGTGACAAVSAAVLNGFCRENEKISVLLPGGKLIIEYTDEGVFMSGGCEKAFEGVVEL